MASELITSPSEPRGFLATPSYLRLWFAGGIGNAMRWLELLVAGIFTYEVTQSSVLVALVTVARSLPMLFIGTIAGVVGEALNRKRLLLTQLFVMAVNSAVLCALAFSAQIRVWHIAVGGIAAVIVWAMEPAIHWVDTPGWTPRPASRIAAVSDGPGGDGPIPVVLARLCAVAQRRAWHRRLLEHADNLD